MRKAFSAFILGAVLMSSLVSPALVSAHTLKTATGYNVPHNHFGYCGPMGCPAPDAEFEKMYGFASGWRVYSATATYNCHGRTFDNRRSWLDYPDEFLIRDKPFIPASPRYGDAVMFIDPNTNRISHTVTLLTPWLGGYSVVMSKYGRQGEYMHTLSSVAKVYPGKIVVVRFKAGTQIYAMLQKMNPTLARGAKLIASLINPFDAPAITSDTAIDSNQPVIGDSLSQIEVQTDRKTLGDEAPSETPLPGDEKQSPELIPAEIVEEILEEREEQPWFDTVREIETAAEIEHEKIEDKVTSLNAVNKKNFQRGRNDGKKIAALIADLMDDRHYSLLGIYNSPEFSTDFITEIEAGKLLVEMAQNKPKLRDTIIAELKKIVDADNASFSDQKRGAALYFLKQIMPQEQKEELKEEVTAEIIEEGSTAGPGGSTSESAGEQMPSYTEFYLEQLSK